MALGPIAFYSPRVHVDDVRHSGERRLARLLVTALQRAGARVEVISGHLTYERHGNEAEQRQLAQQALREADQIVARLRDRSAANMPRLVMTFSNSHLAPDYIGTALSDVLGLPYFIADCSHVVAERAGKWREGFAAAREAITRARKIFCINRPQLAALAQVRTDRGALVQLPPFTDVAPLRAGLGERRATRLALANQYSLDPLKGWMLVVQSMMRGETQAAYHLTAEILGALQSRQWQLLVVGDGPQQGEIRARFRPFRDRVRFLGRLPFETVRNLMWAGDVYVWPATRLEIGSALLDAQVVGMPVVAGRSEAAAEIVTDEETGYLVAQGDVPEFARVLDMLLTRPRQALSMGLAARSRTREGFDLTNVSRLLNDEIEAVLAAEEAEGRRR